MAEYDRRKLRKAWVVTSAETTQGGTLVHSHVFGALAENENEVFETCASRIKPSVPGNRLTFGVAEVNVSMVLEAAARALVEAGASDKVLNEVIKFALHAQAAEMKRAILAGDEPTEMQGPMSNQN